jgi:hypothetical protein
LKRFLGKPASPPPYLRTFGAPGPKKRLKQPDGELGLGGKGAENGLPSLDKPTTLRGMLLSVCIPKSCSEK